MRPVQIALFATCAAPWTLASWGAPTHNQQSRSVSFESVARVFKVSCTSCHNSEIPSGGLDLSTLAGIKEGGASGALFVKGSPEESLIVARIKGLGSEARMPLGFKSLETAQIRLISDWIAQGADFSKSGPKSEHWSYVSPSRPPLPRVSEKSATRNPIDLFVMDTLKRSGLRPAPQADKATLVRRLFLDLIGLPPTVAEMEEYLADTKPGAYDRLVDRLLASPHFGERQAIGWLDLARYADSNGYEADRRRSMWPYRDWVIEAFNKNMPFDRFTIEQIAGDMLPEPSMDQLIATGFHRNTMINEEGGVDKEEQRWLTLVDRVGTTATVWLGSTLACAQCHDHKYDPFSNDDFFRFLAFFDNSEEPTLNVQDPVTLERVRRLGEQIAQLEKVLPELKQDGEPYKAAAAALDRIRMQANELNSMTTLVLKEKPEFPPTTIVRIKGTFTNPGKTVAADTPSVLPPLTTPRKDRRSLAEWLVSRENPLTARVFVNRLWEQYFGTGLVKTSADFGTMGEQPSHPELLDWLACEFMESGWDMKHMHRLIVTSATYRQSSAIKPDAQNRDPQNRLLARGPRVRLPAELIRDNALAASGLLSKKIGGPSVFPDQPEGVWKLPYNGDNWVTSDGPDLFRRGVYTFWRRSAAYPAFLNFDAMSREGCTVKRETTNTPLQALTVLNDEAFFRAARALATKMLNEGKTDEERVVAGFRRALVRRPNKQEAATLLAYLAKERSRFAKDSDAASKVTLNATTNGDNTELAALTMVANVILNLDETITKE